MPVERKRGALSREDMEYITKNVDRFTPEEIAKALDRTVTPIKRYIKNNKLGQKYHQEIEAGEKTEHMILRELKNKAFYKNLKTQLSINEVEYFDQHWVNMVVQFSGDLYPSEEMELKELLILEILKNRESATERTRLERKDQLEKELNREMKLPKDERDMDYIRELRADITSVIAASTNYVKNFKDLCDRAEKMRKALYASRQDRAKDLMNAKIDFSGWLKQLDQYEDRNRIGREMELIRMAKDAAKKDLGSYHTYANKEVAKPILNAETVKDDE